MTDLTNQPLDVITACRESDLPVLKITYACLQKFVPLKQFHIATAARNFKKIRAALGSEVNLLDEDALIPGMTLAELKALPLPFFPKGAGWYFQQFLKYAFAFQNIEDDYYLIWDADTVPLQPMRFFDDHGRMLFTKASERHAPYFQTYRKLLGEDAGPEFSFISQHMTVQKSILREMLNRIEELHPGHANWAWAIMHNLEGAGTNLFSEYETLGNFVKNKYPERCQFRDLPWLREGSSLFHGLPDQKSLHKLGGSYTFSAFEVKDRGIRGMLGKLKRFLNPRS